MLRLIFVRRRGRGDREREKGEKGRGGQLERGWGERGKDCIVVNCEVD